VTPIHEISGLRVYIGVGDPKIFGVALITFLPWLFA
jgi:hypothetical protein